MNKNPVEFCRLKTGDRKRDWANDFNWKCDSCFEC